MFFHKYVEARRGACTYRRPVTLVAALLLALSAAVPVAAGETRSQKVRVDPRWLPWLGNWEPEADRSTRESQRVEALRVLPASDGISVTISAAGKQELQDVVTPDGVRQAIDQLGCQGWKVANWSADGRRVFTRSMLTCGNDVERSLSGLMMISPDGRWTHIQLAQTGDHRALWVQRYRHSGGLDAAVPGSSMDAGTERRLAAGPLKVEDIIEAAGQVEAEVIEAALLQTRSSFAIDSRLLRRLEDAGVSEQVIDLMVAFSFPSRFVVENGEISEMTPPASGTQGRAGSYWPYYGYPSGHYGHLFHLGWYAPFYSYYDPWFFPYSPYWRVGPTYRVIPGGETPSQLSSGGRLIEGRGYTRVRERGSDQDAPARRAQPRHSGGASSSSSGTTAVRSGSSGSSSSGSSGASPSGYSSGSSGGSSSGRQAQPRNR